MANEQVDPRQKVSVKDIDTDEIKGKWVRRTTGGRFRFAGYTNDTFGSIGRCVVLYDDSQSRKSSEERPHLDDKWIVVTESDFRSNFTYQAEGDGN